MIFVDDRDSSYKLLAPLRHVVTPSSLVQSTRLDSADIYFTGNGPDPRYPVDIGIEYKHLGDVLQCVQDGRFAGGQLVAMHEQYRYRWLLIEEKIRVDRSGIILKEITYVPKGKKRSVTKWVPVLCGPRQHFMYRDLMHWLTTMEVMGGARVAFTADLETSAAWIAALYWWWNGKEFDQHRSLKVFHEPSWPGLRKPTRVEKVAKAFDGIGFDRARNIGRHFKTPKDLVNATVEQLMQVRSTRDRITGQSNNDGIGKVTAESLYQQFVTEEAADSKARRK